MMECSGACAPRKADRKIIEKNRRNYMKSLYSTLQYLLQGQMKDGLTLSTSDCITEAADYITELKQRVENLRERKQHLLTLDSTGTSSALTKVLPSIDIQDLSEHLQAVKINQTSTKNTAGFYNTIHLLEEEGVEVLNAHFLTASGSEAPVHDIYLLLSV